MKNTIVVLFCIILLAACIKSNNPDNTQPQGTPAKLPYSNINDILNDFKSEELGFNIQKYGLSPVNITPANDDFLDFKSFGNEYFLVMNFNYNWYNINKFIFKHEGFFVDKFTVIGGNFAGNQYNEYIDEKNNLKILFIGRDDVVEYDPEYDLYNRKLIFNEEGKLTDIQILNFTINHDYIGHILDNEWIGPPHENYSHRRYVLTDDGKFYHYYDGSDEAFIMWLGPEWAYTGYWRVIETETIDSFFIINLLNTRYPENPNIGGTYRVEKISDNEFKMTGKDEFRCQL